MNPLLPIEDLALWAAVLAAGAGFLAWRSSAKCRPRIRLLLAGLRVAGMACLAVIALNPGRWSDLSRRNPSELAILLDRSASMATRDAGEATRWDAASALVRDVRRRAGGPEHTPLYVFADDVEPAGVRDPGDFKADGGATDIRRAVEGVLNLSRSGGRNLAGILLLSDGRQVGGAASGDAALRARARDAPVFPLALGSAIERKDLSIEPLRRHHVTFKGQRTRLVARVRASGLGPIRPAVRLLDGDGAVLGEETLSLEGDGEATVSFAVTPEGRGHQEYRFETAGWEGESTRANNEARVGVAVLDGRIRVLMVEGVPYWDSKFIAQLLRRQPNIEVISVYRLSADRFFRVETDLADAAQITGSVFPDSAAELDLYDLVVFGKGAEYFLTPERIRLLRDFVRDRGGGLLFARGKAYNGEFPELEALEPMEWGERVASPFSVRPTDAGSAAGLFGDMLPGPEDAVWGRLPPLQFAQRVRKLKAFSDVLVEGHSELAGHEQSFPVVVRRRFGKGMVVVVNADGLWQWDFFPSVKDASNMYQEFWSQLVQWSATFSEFLPGSRYALGLSARVAHPGEPVRVRVTQRLPEPGAPAPEVRVQQGAEPARTLWPAPVPEEPGRWEAVFSLDRPGSYQVALRAPGEQDAAAGVSDTLEVLAAPREEDNVSADPDFLRELAALSGGEVVTPETLDVVVRRLKEGEEDVKSGRATWEPAWDRAWFLVFTAFCFAAEWFVRRRNGLL
ncbi:MAG TPA: hypothetical protein P5567_10605 [Kiritimatiellia bacterium]|nr:hypothetical protein [Kiritimatiellia bacterium]HRZ12890.1 hypothetical protein [Kiritimatiellia bacterium]HSA18500.1 hypothetical protein [Kiritimatiellia bacterium]